MMVSRIPTWSTKQLKIPAKMAMPVLALSGFMIAAMTQAPWITLTCLGLAYLISIPFSIQHFRKIVKESKEEFDLTDLALGATIDEDH
jgi:CDP-diacylglycerol--serine O-phosphatidyltransferase